MNNYNDHIEQVKKLFDENKELFIKKNENYGCSYLKSAEIINLILEGHILNLETIDDHVAYQLITRMMDKIIRFCNLRFTSQEDKVEEKLTDTASDLSVYSLMLAELEKPESIKIKKKVLIKADS